MTEWLSEFWSSLTLSRVLIAAGLFALSLAVSFAAIAIVMVKVPPTYFSADHSREFMTGRHWFVRSGALILKNLLGLVLIVLGVLLSLPGVPGQGILTILLGLIMLDIPGKRPLEAKIIQQPRVLAAVNDLRSRYGQPPLIMD
jgi:hypothetical protein